MILKKTMMQHTENNIREMEMLNDLLEIHAENIEIYERFKAHCAGCYFAEFIEDLMQQSHYFIWSIRSYLQQAASHSAGNGNGTVYQAWNDLRALYSVNRPPGLLAAFEYSQDTTIRAYEIALAGDVVHIDLQDMLLYQKEILIDNQKNIRRMQHPRGACTTP